jgi:hypothetical protein
MAFLMAVLTGRRVSAYVERVMRVWTVPFCRWVAKNRDGFCAVTPFRPQNVLCAPFPSGGPNLSFCLRW